MLGYLVLEDQTNVLYFSDEHYSPELEIGIRWNDPLMKVDWVIEPTDVSAKDLSWPYWTF